MKIRPRASPVDLSGMKEAVSMTNLRAPISNLGQAGLRAMNSHHDLQTLNLHSNKNQKAGSSNSNSANFGVESEKFKRYYQGYSNDP